MVHSASGIPTAQTVSAPAHKVGDWAVIVGQWSPDIGQITKVSAKQIRTQRHGDREAHHQISDVVFSGTHQQALDLKSVIVGLKARDRAARVQLQEQHKMRIAAAITKANQPTTNKETQ